MELQFRKTGHDYFEPLRLAGFSCEAMRESIVPDSCADIARIVETTGQVLVTGRELTGDGRFSVGGNVDVSVLYIPEKGEGPRVLRFQIPFQCYGEGPGAEGCDFPDVRGELRSIDARLLNPRKVLARADVVLCPVGCRRVSRPVCTALEKEDGAVQILCRQRKAAAIAAVREKEFSFSEELPLPPGRAAAEVLSVRAEPRGTDSKLIGSKLVVKGAVSAAVLYRDEEGAPALLRQELPFSQVLEGAGLEEDWEYETAFRVLSCECRAGGEEDPADVHAFTLRLLLRARSTVWKREVVDYIADLYSTGEEIACETETLELCEDMERTVRRQNERALLETAVAVKGVLDASVVCGAPQLSGGALRCGALVRCLYFDENDALLSASREMSLTFPAELGEDPETAVLLDASAASRGDVMANIVPEGIEVRFTAECAAASARRKRCVCVCAGTGSGEGDQTPRPSLVLRKVGPGEDLWSVAKQYRTTCESILKVNELTGEEPLDRGRMLLIPRAR